MNPHDTLNIHALRQQPHLSASAIEDYLDCGLAYRFGRVDRITPEYTSEALVFGSCIHKVLEAFHQAKRRGHRVTQEALLRQFESEWPTAVSQTANLRFKEGENEQSLLAKGKELLTVYYQNLPPDSFQVLETEVPFSFTLEELPVPIIGIIDLIEMDDGGNLIVTDFKTSSRAYTREEIDQSLQLSLYHMAAQRNGFGKREILLRFDCLIKTKIPKFEQYYTIRTADDERRAIKKIQHVWNAIQHGVFVPHDNTWKCKSCSFQKHCDRWFRE